MKEIVREYGHMAIAIVGTCAVVNVMEALLLGKNGMAELLFELFA